MPSTPAQMFHMLRRQMLRTFRKPLIVMTPKSLLRHKLSVSSLDELAQRHVPARDRRDRRPAEPKDVRRVVFCSRQGLFRPARSAPRGEGHATSRSCASSSCIRSRPKSTRPRSRRYPHAREVVWCQEEPQNQGAWYQIRHRLQEPLGADQELLYSGRAPGRRAGDRHHADARAGAARARRRRADGHDPRTIRPRSTSPTARHRQQQEEIMTIEVRVPQLPESVADATLVAWRKQPGDTVSATRTSSTSRPTRSCSKCRRRPPACSGN